jgi:acyl carrier protein
MSHDEIVEQILAYVYEAKNVPPELRPLPLDESLYEMGILDSFGVVELVSFVEQNWTISILDSEITKEKFGSVNKMARLIAEKAGAK